MRTESSIEQRLREARVVKYSEKRSEVVIHLQVINKLDPFAANIYDGLRSGYFVRMESAKIAISMLLRCDVRAEAMPLATITGSESWYC